MIQTNAEKQTGTFEAGLLRREISIRNCLADAIWIDGQFEPHEICEMSDDHISNCLAFLQSGEYRGNTNKRIKLPDILQTLSKEYTELFETEMNYRQQEHARK